ncbi:MAG: hypothetical protein GX316_08905, partial [Firmicutes bacterium]|nr:hypothetical protein [Bacillota bacterium]
IFGGGVPTLIDKVKQAVDMPLVEKGGLVQGEPGAPGQDGVGLNYTWLGTQLGVKREDETQYSYTDLRGPKGDTGGQGPPGSDAEVTQANIENALGYTPTQSYLQIEEPTDTNHETLWFAVGSEGDLGVGGIMVQNAETGEEQPQESDLWFKVI